MRMWFTSMMRLEIPFDLEQLTSAARRWDARA